MRFYIDCDDLNVGDVLKFSVHCYASTNNKPFLLDTDDNHNKYYQVNCTPKLNVWAAKTAQKLKWYFVTKIVLTYCEKKRSSDQEKFLKFEAAKVLRSLEQFIQTVKGQNNFW